MKTPYRKSLVALMCAGSLLALSATSQAAGFSVYEWSAKGVGMGNAMMFSDEASLVAFNPAGITRFDEKGTSLFGAVYISPSGTADFYVNGTYVKSQPNRHAPAIAPHGFYARKLGGNTWFGVGLFPRFGLTSSYYPDFMGAFNNYHAEFKTLSFTPVLAWKLSPSLSASLGADIMYADLNIKRAIGHPLGGPRSDMDLHGSSFGFGWHAGLNWNITDRLQAAVIYRSKVKQSMENADINFSGFAKGFTKGGGSVTLPDSWTLGLGYRFDDRTRMEFNAIYTGWSSYKDLDIRFERFFPLPVPLPFTAQSPKNWEDGWRYQIGVEHKLSDRWTLMAGYVHDASVSPDSTVDFMVPTGTRQTYSLGASYTNKNTTWSVGYGYMTIGDRTIVNAGGALDRTKMLTARARGSYAHIIGLSCRIDF